MSQLWHFPLHALTGGQLATERGTAPLQAKAMAGTAPSSQGRALVTVSVAAQDAAEHAWSQLKRRDSTGGLQPGSRGCAVGEGRSSKRSAGVRGLALPYPYPGQLCALLYCISAFHLICISENPLALETGLGIPAPGKASRAHLLANQLDMPLGSSGASLELSVSTSQPSMPHSDPRPAPTWGRRYTPGEADLADTAHVWLLPGVGPHVPRQLPGPHDDLVADGALLGGLGLQLALLHQRPRREEAPQVGGTQEVEIGTVVTLCLDGAQRPPREGRGTCP